MQIYGELSAKGGCVGLRCGVFLRIAGLALGVLLASAGLWRGKCEISARVCVLSCDGRAGVCRSVAWCVYGRRLWRGSA